MKKALIVGIDNYQEVSDLNGCVNDAHAVANVLSRNADGSLNFEAKIMTATSENNIVRKYELEEAIKELFQETMKLRYFISLDMDIQKIITDILSLLIHN